MFTHAIDVATRFTNPFVGLRRRASGEVFTTMGAFIAVNAEGWVLTSGHIVEEILLRKNDARGPSREDEGGDRVVAHSEIWAVPGFMATQPHLVEVHINHVADLGLCKIEPFDAESVSAYPVFRDVAAAPIEQGMSVCRLGFPFCDVPATYQR